MAVGETLVSTLVPLGIFLVCPVLVIWLCMRAKINSDNRRSEVLIEAIRNNCEIDSEKLAGIFAKPVKSEQQIMNLRLLWGLIFCFVGTAILISWIVECCKSGFDVSGLYGSLILLGIGVSFLIVVKTQRSQLKKISENA